MSSRMQWLTQVGHSMGKESGVFGEQGQETLGLCKPEGRCESEDAYVASLS